MSGGRFGSFPSWWVRSGLLRESYRAGRGTGEHIAALKVVLTLAMLSDFRTREVMVSLTELESITGLSRPMVVKGIRANERYGLVTVIPGYKSTYRLNSAERDPYWTKVPISYLRKELAKMPNRGVVVLSALKLYIQLLADRPNESIEMHMTHKTIIEKVGLQPKNVRAALDVLFNHQLLSVTTESLPEHRYRVLNKYTLRGL